MAGEHWTAGEVQRERKNCWVPDVWLGACVGGEVIPSDRGVGISGGMELLRDEEESRVI